MATSVTKKKKAVCVELVSIKADARIPVQAASVRSAFYK